MEIELVIKEEPLDITDNQNAAEEKQQQQQQKHQRITQNEVVNRQYNHDSSIVTKVKEEYDNDDNVDEDNYVSGSTDAFEVVEEQEDIITVNVADLKSADERHFIEHITLPKFQVTARKRADMVRSCQKCQKVFHARASYEAHISWGLCNVLHQNDKLCVSCPMFFKNDTALEEHIRLHRQNLFFCNKSCGKYFETIDRCIEHEFLKHGTRNIICNICNHKFLSYDTLMMHKRTHGKLRCFICSICREWFLSASELSDHWHERPNDCGRLMQDVHAIDDNEDFDPSAIDYDEAVTPYISGNGITTIKRKIPLSVSSASSVSSQDVVKIKMRKIDELNGNNSIYFNTNEISIKEEPIDPSDEIVIKEEPIDYNEVVVKEEPLDNDDDVNGNEDKYILPYNQVMDNPRDDQTTTTRNIGQIVSIRNTSGLKLFKFSPNAKLTTIPSANVFRAVNDGEQIISPSKKQQTSSETNTTTTTSTPAPNKNNNTATATVLIPLKLLQSKKTIAEDDVKKLIADTSKKTEVSERKLSLTRSVINVIESLPQKQEIISNILQQIKNTQNMSIENYDSGGKDSSSDSSQESSVTSSSIPMNTTSKQIKIEPTDILLSPDETSSEASSASATAIPPPPASLFLPLTNICDPALLQARRLHQDYRFVWLCPRCVRQYEQKHSFRSHLITMHGMCHDQLEKLTIEVKPIMNMKRLSKMKNTSASSVTSITTEKGEAAEEAVAKTAYAKGQDSEKKTNKTSTSVRYTCTKCGRRCSSKTMLNDHIMANCSREPQYPCPECEKKFFSASTLNCHMSIHTGELPFKCSYCDKRFRTRGQVTVHHRTHTGERPFLCQVCSQGFTHRETLISHLSRHIGMKRYKCYGCNKQFSCISGLRTHRDIRPDTCGKVKFNSRAIGPRVRVVRGNVVFEPQPEINPYLRTQDPKEVLAEIQNQQND